MACLLHARRRSSVDSWEFEPIAALPFVVVTLGMLVRIPSCQPFVMWQPLLPLFVVLGPGGLENPTADHHL
jgi:hypothetical protein